MFAPSTNLENLSERPTKRRKTEANPQSTVAKAKEHVRTVEFPKLLNKSESLECVNLRQGLFERSWARTKEQVQVRMTDITASLNCLY